MIFKRTVARLRAQDWLAITIELVIVILGVFIGTWVANWNVERAEKAETRRMVAQLAPNLKVMNDYWIAARKYYAATRAYSTTAIAGWRGDPRVRDVDFALAAYQASQIFVLGLNGSSWSTILGADRLRTIDDPQLRADLSILMSSDYSQIDQAGLDTPYRRNVRRIIPVEVQDAIRTQCGDRRVAGNDAMLILPSNCRLVIAPAAASRAAALLRAHPALRDDLQWQVAAVATFLANIVPYENASRRVAAKVAAAGG